MDYQQTLTYINQLSISGVTLGLERIKELLKRLGNPQKQLRCIHVAGTNGKGSACALLESILRESGYKTALYTSPHLVCYNERYQINGICISDEYFAKEVTLVKKHCDQMVCDGFEHPTIFEILTAVAFHYFLIESVDIILLEVGLGGIFVATNVIEKPLLSIIMSIGMDHMEYFGNDIEKIAVEKAGIIKENCPVVLYPQKNLVYNKIVNICKEKKATLYSLQKQVQKKVFLQNIEKTIFSVSTPYYQYNLIDLRLLGDYQILNCITVLLACHVLQKNGISLKKENILNGIQKTHWQGRMEIMNHNPIVLLDGAHNTDGILMLAQSIQKYFKHKKITLLLGVLGDKEYEKMIQIILPLVDKIVLTEPNNYRKLNLEKLEEAMIPFHKPILKQIHVKEAYLTALSITSNKDAVICCGSLYMIGTLRNYISLHSEVLL